MIIYENTLGNFCRSVKFNKIQEEINDLLKTYGFHSAPSEIASWGNSLGRMKEILEGNFPDDIQVAVEYNIPQTSKRVDFLILGKDKNDKDNIVIVELKQWAKVEKVHNAFEHSIMSDLRAHTPVAHPSYQAYSYKELIKNYCNDTIENKVGLIPCAYLHNLSNKFRNILEDPIYEEWINEAPAFINVDYEKLVQFIQKYIKAKPNDKTLLYQIDHGKIKPQKSLQDSLDLMLQGNKEFILLDDQVVARDRLMKAIKDSQRDNQKRVLIVRGGPGTGKSVLAVNVLVESIRDLGLNASYITKNSAPRNCYKFLLSQGKARQLVKLNLAFRSPHVLPNLPENTIDVGLFDEAHRFQKSPYMYTGEDMLIDAIKASKVAIFFVDEDQRITVNDVYNIDSILEAAKKCNAIVVDGITDLESQFRCNGSDAYIAFLDNLLGIKKTSNPLLVNIDFDLRLYKSVKHMQEDLYELNKKNNKSRIVAGYCYDWKSKKNKEAFDIVLEGGAFKARWNFSSDSIWAINPQSFSEVGCIHTCQGLEFENIGVIIGKDLTYSDGQVRTNKAAISKDDRSSGINYSTTTKELADKLIKNTYKVLLTRGQKSCYIYCEDEDLFEYLSQFIKVV